MVRSVYNKIKFLSGLIFKDGREGVEDDPHVSCTQTTKSDKNIEKVVNIIQENHCLSVREVSELTSIDKETSANFTPKIN